MLFDITNTPAQPYKSVCSIDHYNMHISLCICDFENELSIINQVFFINNTGNMEYILTLQRLPYQMNIRLYSTALWYTSKLFEIWTHDELIAETPILPELYLQLLTLSILIFLTSCALLWLTSVQILIEH